MNQLRPLINSSQNLRVPFYARPAFIASFTIATLITGANWYIQSRIALAEKARREQVIQRIASGKTVKLQELRDVQKLDDYEGCRIDLKGEIEVGRFVVKRKRYGEDGYIVLAPFVVGKIISNSDFTGSALKEKYMVNLGWVPKQNRYRIMELAGGDAMALDELPEQSAIDDDAPALATLQAYVRKGENRDILRGYNNWIKSNLYKFIDLQHLSNKYCCVYPSFKRIYLERISSNESLNEFPHSITKQEFIQQVQQQIDYNNKARKNISLGVGIASYASALLLGIL